MADDVLFIIDAPVYRACLAGSFRIYEQRSHLSNMVVEDRCRIAVVVTSGIVGLSRSDMALLPNLLLICTIGTGYENVDLIAARDFGILVTHAAGTNGVAVADHALALLLALVRNIPGYNDAAKAGTWRGDITPRPMLSGKRLGIAGMGEIGRRIARRAEAFDMSISYMATAPKQDLEFDYVKTVLELAERVDCLVCAIPGGSQTRHMIDQQVLERLGPTGYLVNVGRGSVVDTGALIQALNSEVIAGAALDVFEDEPDIPAGLRNAANVILTPHVAGIAPEVQKVSAELMAKNIKAMLSGQRPPSLVPEFRDVDFGLFQAASRRP